MDYIIFKQDGSIKHQSLKHYIQQGNTGVDKILLAKEDITSQTGYTTLAFFTLPDRSTNSLSGVWQNDAVEVEGVTYGGWVFTLTNAQTVLKGSLIASLVLQQGQTQLLTYPIALIVNDTGFKPEADSGMTVEEAQQFLVALQGFQEKYDRHNVRGYQTFNEWDADKTNLATKQFVIYTNEDTTPNSYYVNIGQIGEYGSTLAKYLDSVKVLTYYLEEYDTIGNQIVPYITCFQNGKLIVGRSGKLMELKGSASHITYNDNDLAFVSEVEAVQDNVDDLEEAVQNKLDDKLKNVSFSYSGDTVTITKTKTDTSSTTENIELANDQTAGMMSPADVLAIRQNTQDIANLKQQTVRILYSVKSNPTAAEILAFVQSKGYTDISKYGGIAVIIEATNHVWKWLTDDQTFKDFGLDTVANFTNTESGVIKGSPNDGQLYAENDGTGSVNGWSALKNRVSNVEANKLNKPSFATFTISPSDWDENQEYVCNLTTKGLEVHDGDLIDVYGKPSDFANYRIIFEEGSNINQVKIKVMIVPEEDIDIEILITRTGANE